MITRSHIQNQPETWVKELRDAYVDPHALLNDLGITAADVNLAQSDTGFGFRVPRAYAGRMRPNDPRDPLLLQVIPQQQETDVVPGFVSDPLGEAHAKRSPSLLQKYKGRALLICTGACAINCRYCFRRHFPYADAVGSANLGDAIAEIRNDWSLREIILSGGDPLMLSDVRLDSLIACLENIPHIDTLRIHTRLPVTIPARFDDALLDRLDSSRLNSIIVLHINHANEIDDCLRAACRRVRDRGIHLLNQSVLLRTVNDSAAAMEELSRALFDTGILPYYVHLLDPVAGAAHFFVEESIAQEIATRLRHELPGYLVPKFVREIDGEPAKTPIP